MRQEPNEIRIWSVDLAAAEDGACLTPEELAQASKAIDPVYRRRRVRARSSLRRILGAYVGIPGADVQLLTDAHGKPRLQGGPSFNLSHCEDTMLLAVSWAGAVGVDIERCGRLDDDWREFAQRAFSEAERTQLQTIVADDRPRAALRGWVRKEAYTKARGAGFAYGFSSFTVRLDADGAGPLLVEDIKDPDAPALWRLRDLESPSDFAASLAHAGPAATVSYCAYRDLAS